MSVLAYARRRKTAPRASPAQTFHLPAPIGGLDTISPGTGIPAGKSIRSYNLIGAEYGLRTRLGYREYVTGLDGDPRSILAFYGSTKDGANNRMFACTQSGIWDCTSSTNAPTRVVTFSTQNDDSGWGSCCAFTDLNGNHWLAYCDEANGFYTYAESGSVWTKGGIAGTPLTGVDPATLAYVMPWKNRLWFVQRDTTKAWYLGTNAISGVATAFNFGARFKAGGDLRLLASWTIDGGSGVDDRLVAISGGGDVVIYTGTDPANASTFALTGVWSLGSVPAGRRICTENGGDLLMMSSVGILPISKLVLGNPVYDRSQYQTADIANLFNQLQASTSTLRGWAMRQHPLDSSLIVLVPQAVNQPTQQLVMSLITKGWHQYRDIPMGVCAEPWNGTLFFGSGDGSGRVLANDGYVDGVLLADPNTYTPISWSLVSAFSNLGSPQMKRLQTIAVRVMSQGGAISLNAEARCGFDMSEAALPPPAANAGAAAWDSVLWDAATWAGAYQPQRQVFGAVGIAPEVAVAVRGSSTSRMALVGIDVTYDVGGML